jgi:hypothetical protein
MNLQDVKTPTGKTIKDFQISEDLLKNNPELVDLIMRSESMKDDERQYWFNLTAVMKPEQIKKLRGILAKERRKLAEIDAKYGKKTPEDSKVAAKRAQKSGEQRAQKQKALRATEASSEANEIVEEARVLAELENL